MIREVAIAVACLALVIFVPGIIYGAAPPPKFYDTVIQNHVAIGEPILIQVVGPPNDTFTVTLNPEPFNTSQPVFSKFYVMPPVSSLANGSAIGEVSVNTSLFAISAYRLTLSSANSTVFGQQLVYVTVGTPTAVLAGEIEQLQFELRENASRVLSLAYALDQENTIYLYVVGLCTTLFLILLVVIIVTRTSAGERRLGRALKRAGHGVFFRGEGGIEATGHWAVPKKKPEGNPEAVWWAPRLGNGQCKCNLWSTREGLLAHIVRSHRMNAVEATEWMEVSKEAQRDVREEISEQMSARGRRLPRKTGVAFEMSGTTDGATD